MPKNISLHIEEAQQISNRTNPITFVPRHIIVKVLKTEDEGKKTKNKKLESSQREMMHYL